MCYFERLCRIMFFLFEHSSSWTALMSVRSLRYGGKWLFVDHFGLLPTVGICFCSSFRYFSQYIFSIFPMSQFPLIHCLFGCVFEVELPSHRYQQPLSKKERKKERKKKQREIEVESLIISRELAVNHEAVTLQERNKIFL
jgi:hypothetical protein